MKHNQTRYLLLFIFFTVVVYFLYRFTPQPKQTTRSRAGDELTPVPQQSHAQLCRDLGGHAITPFNSCPSGTKRYTEIQSDPLFFCCVNKTQ